MFTHFFLYTEDTSMRILDRVVAADDRMRQFESVSKPIAGGLITNAETIAETRSLVTDAPVIGAIAKAFGVRHFA